MTIEKPFPKSLHTVTVLVRLAKLFQSDKPYLSNQEALDIAYLILNPEGRPDNHCLFEAATDAMGKGK